VDKKLTMNFRQILHRDHHSAWQSMADQGSRGQLNSYCVAMKLCALEYDSRKNGIGQNCGQNNATQPTRSLMTINVIYFFLLYCPEAGASVDRQ
jgi:hypothetical protein